MALYRAFADQQGEVHCALHLYDRGGGLNETAERNQQTGSKARLYHQCIVGIAHRRRGFQVWIQP